jgi:4-hydroxythreonine-4-phosphate dehydrogenase
MNTPPLAITMGDASGVGPEILLRAFASGELGTDVVAVGDLAVLDLCNRRLQCGVTLEAVERARAAPPGRLGVLDQGAVTEASLRIGEIDRTSGAAALAYVARATRLAIAGEAAAIVTLPINKAATRLSAPTFTGHTEYVAELCGRTSSTLMLASERAIVTHVSTHVSLREAIALAQPARILEVIRQTNEIVGRLRPSRRIGVAGLNPHAGEGGAFGDEDATRIAPAIAEARAEGLAVTGPHPPDTVFLDLVQGRIDAVVCMYHDQGHIPMKLLDFRGGVNVTLGLPIVRTSVDHGTAFDIAWKGVAFTDSLRDACAMARRLATFEPSRD